MNDNVSKTTMERIKQLQDMWSESDVSARSMTWREGDKFKVAIPTRGSNYPMPDYSVLNWIPLPKWQTCYENLDS
jgi:hypothetical protein